MKTLTLILGQIVWLSLICCFQPGTVAAQEKDWRSVHAATLSNMPELAKLCETNANAPHVPKARSNKIIIDKPGILDKPDTEYVLASDINSEGTAFAISASRVTFNLNGHIIRYGGSGPEASHGIEVKGYNHKDIQVIKGTIEQTNKTELAPGSSPVSVPHAVGGFEVSGLILRWNSPQTHGVNMPWGAGIIRDNILIDDGSVVLNRHQAVCAVNVSRASNTTVVKNAIVRARQSGISIGEKYTNCSSNIINIDSVVTNSSGVGYYGDKGLKEKKWTCAGNIINGTGVHPIGIGVVSQASEGTVENNHIEVKCTKTSAEYGNKPIGAAAYRTTWGANNIIVRNNTFVVHGSKGSINGQDSWGRAIWVAANKNDQIRFEKNTIKALADHYEVKVAGIAVTGNNETSGLIFDSNDVESTWATVLLADDYGWAKAYPVFYNNTFRISGSNPISKWLRDDYRNWSSTGLFSDNTVIGTKETDWSLDWSSKEVKEILFGKQVTLQTHDIKGNFIPDKQVEISDASGTVLTSAKTDKNGTAVLYVPIRCVTNRDATGVVTGKRQERDITSLSATSVDGDLHLSATFDPRTAELIILTPQAPHADQ